MDKKYDVFISHASKDKVSYVDRLAKAIQNTGIKVFYDSDSIDWGDNIQSVIEDALAKCTLAVVVISKNYFGRQWTEHEIRTLLQRQNVENRKIVLPILHNISKKQLVEHYPDLNNIQFKYSKQCSCDEMAKSIINILEQEYSVEK